MPTSGPPGRDSAGSQWPGARAARILTLWGLAIGVAVGCSRTPEKLYPVEGTVRVGGQPLNGGTVQFEMLERGRSGKVYTASGIISPDGAYRLRTFDRDGAPAGQHRVWVVPNFAAMPDEIGMGVERMSPIPRKYMLPTETDLLKEVEPGNNVIDIDIPG